MVRMSLGLIQDFVYLEPVLCCYFSLFPLMGDDSFCQMFARRWYGNKTTTSAELVILLCTNPTRTWSTLLFDTKRTEQKTVMMCYGFKVRTEACFHLRTFASVYCRYLVRVDANAILPSSYCWYTVLPPSMNECPVCTSWVEISSIYGCFRCFFFCLPGLL